MLAERAASLPLHLSLSPPGLEPGPLVHVTEVHPAPTLLLLSKLSSETELLC